MFSINLFLKPLILELKTGCKNIAVFGGFEPFALRNLKALHDAGEISNTLFSNAALAIKGYATLSVDERRNALSKLRALLTEAPEPTPIKKSPVIQKRDLDSSIIYLKGVGVVLGKRLSLIGITTIKELLYYFPSRYIEYRDFLTHEDLQDGAFISVSGTIISAQNINLRNNLKLTKAILDCKPMPIILNWFNQPFKLKSLSKGAPIRVYGKLELKYGEWKITNPDIEPIDKNADSKNRILPIYPLTENLSQNKLRSLISTALEYLDSLEETLPIELLNKYSFLPIKEAIRELHHPSSEEMAKVAKARFIYEELFNMQCSVLSIRYSRMQLKKSRRYPEIPDFIDRFEACLPFKFTPSQRRVISEIYDDLHTEFPMSRLLQGDVGSGKTAVAAALISMVAACGFQCAIMAPTEILAEQHYEKFLSYLSNFGLKAELFTGSISGKEREKRYEALANGEIDVAVGTHALIQEKIQFKNLAFCVIDEQHRFGVMQRTALSEKGENPDLLVMTATPIPRSLALTIYGDLAVSVIDGMPPGRQSVKSYYRPMSKLDEVYQFIISELKKGRQAYLVCPLVDESDKIEAESATSQAELLSTTVFKQFHVGLLHGKMSPTEKTEIMDRFRSREIELLISTTVIEVGVDVPNATVMAILNSERFGLAQLHQLRGRVGRGAEQSYCFFVANLSSTVGRERMKTIVNSENGFEIAEKDLQLRGPGEFGGVRQSGLPDLKLVDLVRDCKVMEKARLDASEYLLSKGNFKPNPDSFLIH